jgi:hypothetical protein
VPTELPLNETHADNDAGHTRHHNDLAHRANAAWVKGRALRQWWSALANRHFAPAKVTVLGDSFTEGWVRRRGRTGGRTDSANS